MSDTQQLHTSHSILHTPHFTLHTPHFYETVTDLRIAPMAPFSSLDTCA